MAAADRVLYCVSGAWTDAWYDDPSAWWQWCSTFLGWTPEQWQRFATSWYSGSDRVRRRLTDETGLHFFDWTRVPGGSIRGSTRAAAALIAADLGALDASADVTVIGHSKGGQAIKHLLAEGQVRPSRVVLVDAPLDWLRETAGRLMGLGIDRCRLPPAASPVPVVTINNWLDPSGGRLAGRRNYQTLVWQDYLNPYPPHGMKGFLATRVLGDLGALPGGTGASGAPGGADRDGCALRVADVHAVAAPTGTAADVTVATPDGKIQTAGVAVDVYEARGAGGAEDGIGDGRSERGER
jgi:hypothetical protein